MVDLADGVGRDYTTVSRQVAKLESLGLIERRASETDARVRMASVTPEGQAMSDALDTARAKKARAIFAAWEPREVEQLVALLPKFAAALGTIRETEIASPMPSIAVAAACRQHGATCCRVRTTCPC